MRFRSLFLFKALVTFSPRREAEALPRAAAAANAVTFAKKLRRRSTTAPGARPSVPKLPALSEQKEEPQQVRDLETFERHLM